MKKTITRLLVLLLTGAVLLGMAACAATDAPEPTQAPVIRVPEPVNYETCTELGTPLADVRVRQALALAIDMDTVIEALYHGTAQKMEAGEGCSYDPDKAKELLAEAGWPSDYVLDVVYDRTEPQVEDLLNVLVHYWEAVGIRAEVRKLEGDASSQLWTAPEDPEGDSAVKWDLAICPVSDLTEAHYYCRFASDFANNSHTPAIDGLNEAIGRGDTETAETILRRQVAVIPLLSQNGFVCISDSLNSGAMVPGNDRYAYDKDILNWIVDREDGTIYTAEAPEEGTLCPLAEPGGLYQELVFDRLLDADSGLNPTQGRIAESYTLNENVAEFTIREDLCWHDGEPLTAEDVKFTFELYLKCPDTPLVLMAMLEKLEGAEKFVNGDSQDCSGITVEENKVTFSFAETAEDALLLFSQWPILPKHKLENVAPAKLQSHRFWKDPVGSGPFTVAELEPGETCLLERWEDYWQEGSGNISFVRMHASKEGPAVLAARELLDYGWGLSGDDAAYIGQLEHMDLMTVESGCKVCIFINQYPHESYFLAEEETEPTE